MYKLKILDSKPLGDKIWLLCKGNLDKYLSELKEDFYNFSIQRKIVKNQYLDTLITTVKQGDPIPIITLTYQQANFTADIGSEISIDMQSVEILDGLQRSFRLWAHKILMQEYQQNSGMDIVPFTKLLKEKKPELFDTGVLSLSKIRALFEDGGLASIQNVFNSFEIYFVLWINLKPKQIIHKMLVLNAGQRSVSKTHQFELLFLYLWEELVNNTEVKLFREKDPEANAVKSGKREVGDFIFSSIIVGLRSFLERKPLRVSTDDLDIDEMYNEVNGEDVNENIFTVNFIGKFLGNIKEVDAIIQEIEPKEGKKWFVKDTTLSGLLAALGSYANVKPDIPLESLEELTAISFDRLKSKLAGNALDLEGFTKQYNILSSRSVNIGAFIRKVVMNYILGMLKDENPTWENSFNSNLKKP